MSSHARRRKHGGDHENHERWLLTYADMITLLVAFFIMLYAMSVTNTAKFNKLALSVRSGFGNVTGTKPSILSESGGGDRPTIAPSVTRVGLTPGQIGKINSHGDSHGRPSDNQKKTMEQIAKIIKQSRLSDHLKIHQEERGIVVSVIADKYTFDSGSADLKEALKPVLDKIGQVIERVPNSVRVEGHTDDLPISTDRFPSNWNLSAVRAANVISYLVAKGDIQPDRCGSAGYADTRPTAPNTTEHNRAMNRRVEIVILNGDGA